MDSIVKIVLLSIIGLFLSNTMYSQESAMSPKEKEDLGRELTAKREELFRSNGLNTMNTNTLKSLVGDRVCFKTIDGYTTIGLGNQRDTIWGSDILEVVKVHTMNTNIKYLYMKVRRNDEEIKIPASDYDEFIRLSVRDSIMQALDNMRQEAENNALEARNKEWKENLEKYHQAIAKFNQPQSGPIAIKAQERAYDGTMPFNEFLMKSNITGFTYTSVQEKFSTFIDESFSFHPKRLPNYRGNQDIIGDTFGICIDEIHKGYSKQVLFINLRTGEEYLIEDMKSYLESNSYLKIIAQVPDFVYDGTYSINEVLDPLRFGDENSEKICDALVGEQVFILETLQYDTIASVKKWVSSYNDDVSYTLRLGGGKEYSPRGVVSVKWYQQLQKFIGHQVLRVRTQHPKFNVNDIYLEDLPKLGPWTIEKIEAGKDERGLSGLYVTIRKGNDVETVDWSSCILLTHDIDFEREYEGVKYPNPLILSYDYMKANVVKMPEYVKQEEKARQKYLEAALTDALTNGVANGVMVGMSISTFLRNYPKAKLINSTVNSKGKVAKVYHTGSWEVVFVNGKCTSCTKLK